MTPAETRVFAGIDEAGLGPLLGPLTLGWSAFRVPRGAGDLWSALGRIVTREPGEDRDHLVVADSKRVHARNGRGRRRLESTVLAFLAQGPGPRPRRGADLFELAPAALRLSPQVLADHPWYAYLPPSLPCHVEADRLELRAHQLRHALEGAGTALIDAGVRILPAGVLNQSFTATGNKARTHWLGVAGIVRHLWEELAEQGLSLFVDRLGGRMRYRRLLVEAFPRARVSVQREDPSLSEYHVTGPTRRMRITFAERCEERSFAVALASCLAKYARELSMEAFNRFFGEFADDLRPTAGYTADGRRWLEEARPALELARIPRGVLVRDR